MATRRVCTIEPPSSPQPGERIFVRCEGGPCLSRLVESPAPLEIEDAGGLYVLDDAGGHDDWVYVWIPTEV